MMARRTVPKRMLEEQGATAVEYAILAPLIAAVIAAIVATLGQQVLALFTSVVGRF